MGPRGSLAGLQHGSMNQLIPAAMLESLGKGPRCCRPTLVRRVAVALPPRCSAYSLLPRLFPGGLGFGG